MSARVARPRGDVAARAMAGSAVGLVNVVLGIGTAVATVPLLLRHWDQQTYAVWVAVFAVYSLLQTADTGHTGYLGNEFLRLAHSDPTAYRRTFASGLRIAIVLGAAQLLLAVALLLVGLVPRVLGIPLSGSAAATAGLSLVALALGWWASGSFGGVIAGLYLPAGDFVRAQGWAIASRVLLFACLVGPAVAGYGVLGAAVATGVGNVVFTLLLLADAWRRYPITRHWAADASWGLALGNVRRSLVVTGNNASAQLSTSGLALAVSSLLGAAMLLSFTTLRTLANAATAVTTVVVSPLVPDMVRYRTQEDWGKLHVCFEACWWGVGLLVHLGTLACFPIAGYVYTLWTGGRIPFDAPLFAVLAWTIGLAGIGAPALRYLQAMNRLAAQSLANASYFAALASALPLALTPLGLSGVGIALALAELVRTLVVIHRVAVELPPGVGERLRSGGRHASVPLLLSGAVLAAAVWVPAAAGAICAAGLLLLGGTYVVQWRTLDPQFRERMRRALPSLTPARSIG
jgi:O-antigen/teichoic acid export membrane protein